VNCEHKKEVHCFK